MELTAERRLVLHGGRPDERSFPLGEGTTSIGRGEENGVFVADASLSRKHAQVERVGERVSIVDLGSKNGSFVNGDRVERRELRPGDLVRLGEVEFAFVVDAVPHAAAPTLSRDIVSLFSRPARVERPAARGPESRLAVLLQVSQILSSPGDIDSTLERVVDLAFQILDIDRAALLLLEPGGELVARVVRSRVPVDPGQRIWSRSIVDHVISNCVAALFADARADLRIDTARSVAQQAISASMCAPLKAGERLLGVLYVDSVSRSRLLGAEDLDLLAGFANQAAIALDNSLLHETLRAEAVRRTELLRFFPPRTAQRILESGGGAIGVVETNATALFCDISDYSSIAAGLSPRAVVDLLNEYFPIVAEIVFRHEGTLEKYIGDALLAVWGVPFVHDDDADRAVAAAVEMQRAVRGRRFRIHVGLHTGLVAAGNVGTRDYVQYATVGESTNLASRICSVAGQGEIVISSATLEALRSPPRTEALPPASLKGHEGSHSLHRVCWE